MYSAVYYADDEEAATWPSVSTLSIPFHILPFITGTQAILNPTFAVTLPDPCPPRYSHAVNHNKIFWRNCPSGPKWRCTFQMEFLFLSFFVGIQSNFSFVYSSFVTEKHKRDNSLCVATFWNAMQKHKVHFVFVFFCFWVLLSVSFLNIRRRLSLLLVDVITQAGHCEVKEWGPIGKAARDQSAVNWRQPPGTHWPARRKLAVP